VSIIIQVIIVGMLYCVRDGLNDNRLAMEKLHKAYEIRLVNMHRE
jgi:hypothetical protein